MIKVGIIGISGYSGGEALRILLKHPEARITYVAANNTTGRVDTIWPGLSQRTHLVCRAIDVRKAASSCDLIFLAVPHTESMRLTPKLMSVGMTVIDLSGDYRLKNATSYKRWYGTEHADKKNLTKAVYGLPELYREDIKKAKLIANPGCYPTAALLALAPLAAIYGSCVQSITIDAKSGVSGAGRKTAAALHFCEISENFRAYKVLNHQHAPEIEFYTSKLAQKPVKVDFVPHLLPISRGILETIYVRTSEKLNLTTVIGAYKHFYKTEPFVRIVPVGEQPELKNVTRSNFCDIGLNISADKKLLVITSAIDNLVKGAAGQAVQNMNIICGFKETDALL